MIFYFNDYLQAKVVSFFESGYETHKLFEK
jgi:hypothetical protein